MGQESSGRAVMCQGRIVWTAGDLFKGRTKTIFGTQTARTNQAGETMMEFGFGLAVPKSVLNQCAVGQPGEIWAAIHEEAYKLFPNRQIPPSFAMKYKDGDGLDDKGLSFSLREGYAGHLVFACTTSLPIKFFKFENGQNFMISEGIKCGDYVNVQLTIKAHPAVGQGKAGLYMNPNAVQFLGFGKEIVNAPSGDQIFGTVAPALPAGASAMPIAPQGGAMLVPQGPATPAPMPGYGQQTPQTAPPMPVQPHFAVVPQQFQPPAGGAPAPYQQPAAAPANYPQQPGMPTPVGYPQPH